MSRGEIPAKELEIFLRRPKFCGYCGAPESESNPLVLHHCFFRSQGNIEKAWNYDWACVHHHTEGPESAHHNYDVAEHFRRRAVLRRDGKMPDNPLNF